MAGLNIMFINILNFLFNVFIGITESLIKSFRPYFTFQTDLAEYKSGQTLISVGSLFDRF